MNTTSSLHTATRWLAAGAAAAAGGYAAYAAVTWARYGKPSRGTRDEQDSLLDRFMPAYEIVERHHIAVNAPADVTLDAAKRLDLSSSTLIKAIFNTRQLVLQAKPEETSQPKALLEQVLALGWGILAETPGREVVIGAVTKPWEGNVKFRALTPEDFAGFDEPGYVKIVWTLRADPLDASRSTFRTETRAIATDPVARDKFRMYWSCVSPGVQLIRRLMLAPLKKQAEQIWLDPSMPRLDGEQAMPGVIA
jgi:hypothetical protein